MAASLDIETKIKLAFQKMKDEEDIFDMDDAKLLLFPTSITSDDFQQVKRAAFQANPYKFFGFLFEPTFGFIVVVSEVPSWHSDMMKNLNELDCGPVANYADRWLYENPLRCFVSSVNQSALNFYTSESNDEIESNRKIIRKGLYMRYVV